MGELAVCAKEVYLALGSNEVSPAVILRRAISSIHAWPNTQVLRVSNMYQTIPVGGPPNQGAYLNGMIAIKTQLSPESLLEHIRSLEKANGRERLISCGPRPLDIDLILYGSEVVNSHDLIIPHPRHLIRDFVLLPLQDIHSTGILPSGEAIAAALAALDDNNIIQIYPFPKEIAQMATQLPDLWNKKGQEKITALTAYDVTLARLCSQAGVDVILVGDSLGQVVQGQDTTIPVTIEDMVYHTECVAKGNQGAWLIADMPFMTYTTPEQACEHAAKLMRAGAQMVKLEGGLHLVPIIEKLNQFDIPVCAHLGLRPQSVHMMGGYKVQGKEQAAAQQIVEESIALERAGAKLCVLECIPPILAAEITRTVRMPIIGIGAGSEVDGQILVIYDALGMTEKTPRFVKNFLESSSTGILGAIQNYVTEVRGGTFPQAEHSYAQRQKVK